MQLRTKPIKSTKKLLSGLDYLVSLCKDTRPKDLSATELRKYICKEETPAGALLRSCLIVTHGYTVGKKSKTYKVDYNRLFELVKEHNPTALPSVLTTTFSKVQFLAVRNDNPFERTQGRTGKQIGHRLYNDITYLTSEVRAALLKRGFDYDICAAIANILYQAHIKAGGQELDTYGKLIANRTAFRKELSDFSGIPVKTIKKILAAILNGSRVQHYKGLSVWELFNQQRTLCSFEDFTNHPLITGLKSDARIIYDTIIPSDERTRVEKVQKNGARLVAKSQGWHQFRYYEEIENEIMQVVADHLEVPAWFIHDGFMTQIRLNQDELIELTDKIKEQTGFNIQFEEDVITDLEPN